MLNFYETQGLLQSCFEDLIARSFSFFTILPDKTKSNKIKQKCIFEPTVSQSFYLSIRIQFIIFTRSQTLHKIH